MSRRSHKKSRNGCVECKRRHIRCDGNLPVCANCASAERHCSFESTGLLHTAPGFGQTSFPVATSSLLPVAPSDPRTPTSWSETSTPRDVRDHVDSYHVNMTHIMLMNHILSEEARSLEQSGLPDILPSSIYVKYGLATPYLMHEVLAASALHLSISSTDSRALYRDYATGLQNRALSLFKESNPVLEVTEGNCVQMFLFSSLLGVHLLCDALYHSRASLEEFTDSLAHCLTLYRGVATVMGSCRHHLRETELEPYLQAPASLMESTDSNGPECEKLLALLADSDLSPPVRDAYREATLHLQQAFEAGRTLSHEKARAPMVLVWPALISSIYVDMLRERAPEALVVLAYYAVLLHRANDLWIFGDGGRFLIESISEQLGDEWEDYMNFPKRCLEETPVPSA